VRVRRRRAFWDSLDGVIQSAAAAAAAGGGGRGGGGGGGDMGDTAVAIAGEAAGLSRQGSGSSAAGPGSPMGSPGSAVGSPGSGAGSPGSTVGSPRGVERGMSWKVFPQFVAEGWNKGAVEEGEGHGPRKEFFALAGRDMCGRGSGRGRGGEGGNAAVITKTKRTTDANANHADDAEMTVKDTDEEEEEANCPPLFAYNREAGAEWFNQSLPRSKRLESAYRFAGWLMGQAMNNRCELDVRLPRVLFTRLLEGVKFAPTAELLQAVGLHQFKPG
jgi:hypothetical protein